MRFRGFLDIKSVYDILDEKTVWKYKNILAEADTWDKLFTQFNEHLDTFGLIVKEGKIINASFVLAQGSGTVETKTIK